MNWVLPTQKNSNLIESLYKSRGIKDKDLFFSPTLDQIHDPFLLHNMKIAVKAIETAVKQKEKIFIHGDFDVDGITATSILWSFLYKEMKADALPYVPNRFTDGYGLSENSVQEMIKQGAQLIITVDCGVKDLDIIHKYSSKVKFIITDHHTIRKAADEESEYGKIVGEYLISKDALAVVHPQLSPHYPFKEICGAVVSWKLAFALNKHLKLGVDMLKYIDLAALGTVCDVMPLIDENRAIVSLGLKQINNTQHIGLKALIKVSQIKTALDAYHLGFVIGPRLNASGRLDTAMDGVRLLTTSSQEFAEKLALKLNRLNSERQELTKKYLMQAEDIISKQDQNNKLFLVYGEDWPEGIVGLIAGKLIDRYNRPILVASLKNKILKGSARSIPSFHVADNLKYSAKFLLSYGGHAQAAGFSLAEENIENFRKFILELANANITDDLMVKSLKIDAVSNTEELNIETAKEILKFSPFGFGNKKPLIALTGTQITSYKEMGSDKTHIRLSVKDDCGSLECVGFSLSKRFKDEILDLLYSTPSKRLDLAGHLDIDTWNGNSRPVFKIEDFRISE